MSLPHPRIGRALDETSSYLRVDVAALANARDRRERVARARAVFLAVVGRITFCSDREIADALRWAPDTPRSVRQWARVTVADSEAIDNDARAIAYRITGRRR